MAGENSKWQGISRDLTMVGVGMVIGGALTAGAGYATDSIRTPEEREAAQKAGAAQKK